MTTKTIKQINAYAQELIAQGMNVDWHFDEKMLDFIGESGCKVLNNNVYLDDNYEYIASIDFTEDYSKLEAHVFKYDDWKEWCDIMAKWEWKNRNGENDYDSMPGDMTPEFTVEVPDTRGYSDTSKRDDTRLYDLDIRCAVDEAVSKHLGKGKCYPWMLKQFICAEEFGLTEDEFDYELECVCKSA